MTGLNIKLAIVALTFSFMSCSSKSSETKRMEEMYKYGDIIGLRSIQEDDVFSPNKYKFYLLYFVHRPYHLSYAVSIRLKDSIAYSYVKYLDNIASTHYPPVSSLQKIDSLYYSTSYLEISPEQFKKIKEKIENVRQRKSILKGF